MSFGVSTTSASWFLGGTEVGALYRASPTRPPRHDTPTAGVRSERGGEEAEAVPQSAPSVSSLPLGGQAAFGIHGAAMAGALCGFSA